MYIQVTEYMLAQKTSLHFSQWITNVSALFVSRSILEWVHVLFARREGCGSTHPLKNSASFVFLYNPNKVISCEFQDSLHRFRKTSCLHHKITFSKGVRLACYLVKGNVAWNSQHLIIVFSSSVVHVVYKLKPEWDGFFSRLHSWGFCWDSGLRIGHSIFGLGWRGQTEKEYLSHASHSRHNWNSDSYVRQLFHFWLVTLWKCISLPYLITLLKPEPRGG